MVSAARSQNRTTLGSATTRGASSEPSVEESCGPMRANSRESLFCAILSSGRVRHAATHRSATSAPIRMGGNIFDQWERRSTVVCGTTALAGQRGLILVRQPHRTTGVVLDEMTLIREN